MYSRLFAGVGTARNFSSICRWTSLPAAVKPRSGGLGWVRTVVGRRTRQTAAIITRRIMRLLYRRAREGGDGVRGARRAAGRQERVAHHADLHAETVNGQHVGDGVVQRRRADLRLRQV